MRQFFGKVYGFATVLCSSSVIFFTSLRKDGELFVQYVRGQTDTKLD